MWTYWKGAYRDTGKDEGATMVLQTADKHGWFWYIPLHDDIVSVGVVAPAKYAVARGAAPREQIYTEEVEHSAPPCKQRIAGATQRHRLLRHQGLLVSRDRRTPAKAG